MKNQYDKLPSLSFVEAVKSVLSNLINFRGRSRRSELWWYFLLYFVVYMILSRFLKEPTILNSVILYALNLTLAAVTVRRLHDRGQSGLWVLASYVIGLCCAVYIYSSRMLEITKQVNYNPEELVATMMNPIFIVLCVLSLIVNITIFVFAILDGKPEENKYGYSPKYAEVDDDDEDCQ